jgi:hypothetical protein
MYYPVFNPSKIQLYFIILQASFTKSGVTYFAKDYGKRAFRIPVNLILIPFSCPALQSKK